MASIAAAAATTAGDNNSPSVDTFSVNVTSCASPAFPGETPCTDILVSIVPPDGGTRPPTDVCCVVDVSGSMGVECTNGDSESQGLSVMDVVKHACKTVLNCLTAQDRFSVVAYSTSARVALALTYVDAPGMAKGNLAINGLSANGQTNLWDGLHSGLKVLNEGDDNTRMKAVLLLTDGQPNISPPRGHVPMLQQYKEETGMLCTISTFGFGYNLDSQLLKDIATEGQGMYAFIPDGSFVGTAFVNATSNVLATAARNVVLKVSGLPEAVSEVISVPGHNSRVLKASWGIQVPLGSVQFGQTKDVVVAVPTAALEGATGGALGGLRADVEFSQSGSTDTVALFGEGPVATADMEATIQGLRLRVVDSMNEAVSTLGVTMKPPGSANEDAAASKRAACAAHLKSSSVLGGSIVDDPRVKDLLLDVDGQYLEAISRVDWYKKWGRHYLPSLACAHMLQQCNNFKDPGVQHYGGPLFTALRDTAEGVFLKIPPPEPSSRPIYGGGGGGGYGSASSSRGNAAPAPRAAASPQVDMSQYYNRGGGCFTGDATVTAYLPSSSLSNNGDEGSDGTVVVVECGEERETFVSVQKRVDELCAGDLVKAFRQGAGAGGGGVEVVEEGMAVVGVVVETLLSAPILLVPIKGVSGATAAVRLTPWHPILLPTSTPSSSSSSPSSPSMPSSTTEWAFPAEAAASQGKQAPPLTPLDEVKSVFNVALLPPTSGGCLWHGVVLNESVKVITLGHGITNDKVASHPYYGTDEVLKDLAAYHADGTGPDSAAKRGRVVVTQEEGAAALERHNSDLKAPSSQANSQVAFAARTDEKKEAPVAMVAAGVV